MMTMTLRGTPYFMAPEVFEERYGVEADVWSVGGVAIQMVCTQALYIHVVCYQIFTFCV